GKARHNVPPSIITKRPLQISRKTSLLAPFRHRHVSNPKLNHPLHKPKKMLPVGGSLVQIQLLNSLRLVVVPSEHRTRLLANAFSNTLFAVSFDDKSLSIFPTNAFTNAVLAPSSIASHESSPEGETLATSSFDSSSLKNGINLTTLFSSSSVHGTASRKSTHQRTHSSKSSSSATGSRSSAVDAPSTTAAKSFVTARCDRIEPAAGGTPRLRRQRSRSEEDECPGTIFPPTHHTLLTVTSFSRSENKLAPMTESGTAATPSVSLKLLVLVAILVVLAVVIVLLIFFLCFRGSRSWKKRKLAAKHSSGSIPLVSKEIMVVKASDLTPREIGDDVDGDPKKEAEIKVEIEAARKSDVSSGGQRSELSVEDPNIGWGRWYTIREVELATRGFAEGNVIGEGGYGIVYRGLLQDGSVVAVKNLLNNKGQAEKEFKVEVEAIGKVRHKNLVRLVGYCAEGARRMLVYEYVDNGNLEQWLHGDVGPVSPLTWDIRMRIAIGTAKGLAYLHEGLEPKVVHRDIKSSNILLDKNWNAKVSDFGLAKLLGSEKTHVTTRVMGTFGYVAPEYASSGMLNERSDVYSFGVLLMEIITGRSPIDYTRAPGEMNLVDWFKAMVASRRSEELVDSLIEVPPSPRSLKRVLLICLRCIDLDVVKRPKMGQIVHMLETDDFPFRSVSTTLQPELRTVREKDPAPSHADVSIKVPYPPKHAE
ncbi:putative receptor-like serine/threonine-protein kinase, partial [Mucuna pruriens]